MQLFVNDLCKKVKINVNNVIRIRVLHTYYIITKIANIGKNFI